MPVLIDKYFSILYYSHVFLSEDQKINKIFSRAPKKCQKRIKFLKIWKNFLKNHHKTQRSPAVCNGRCSNYNQSNESIIMIVCTVPSSEVFPQISFRDIKFHNPIRVIDILITIVALLLLFLYDDRLSQKSSCVCWYPSKIPFSLDSSDMPGIDRLSRCRYCRCCQSRRFETKTPKLCSVLCG